MQHLITSTIGFAGLLLVMIPAEADEIHYACADNTRLAVTFSGGGAGPGTARLAVNGSTTDITLPQVLSADGGRYARDGTEFWVKGNSARLSRTGTAATICHVK